MVAEAEKPDPAARAEILVDAKSLLGGDVHPRLLPTDLP